MFISAPAFSAVPNCFTPDRPFAKGKFSVGFRASVSQEEIQRSLHEIENAGFIVTQKTLRPSLKLVSLNGVHLRSDHDQSYALSVLEDLLVARLIEFAECQPARTMK